MLIVREGHISPGRSMMTEKKADDVGKGLEGGLINLSKGTQGFQDEFVDFLKKYQVIGLAVAVVIGTAATKLVTATVSDLIMPLIAVLVPNGDWRSAVFQVGPIKFLLGDFVGAIIDFVIIALVIFIVVKYIMKGDTSKKV